EKEAVINWIKSQKYWDLSELECYLIEEYGVVFKSLSSYYELLNEAKISWQKAQKKNPKKDPEVVKKRNEEIKSKLEERNEKIRARKLIVYAIDEVHLLEGDLISHGWGECKNRLKIPINNEKDRQTYYGALNLFEPDLIVREYPAGNGENTVNFVKELIKINQEEAKKNNEKEERQILIIWDGAAYHKGQEMRKLLGCINQNLTEEEWKVTCELFAPNAPEENPIEAVWLQLKNLLRRCHRFCKNFKIINRLFKLLVDLKLFNFPDIEKYDAFSCLI
ncbi:MAG: IS630 family transposase, partial [Okeania sp. SIO2D1]|nr:IS630 family transposase [Okeania sp. SIO2D1]